MRAGGLTDDRQPVPRRQARPTLEQFFAAAYFDYSRYISPVTRRLVRFEEAVDWLIGERDRYFNRQRSSCRKLATGLPFQLMRRQTRPALNAPLARLSGAAVGPAETALISLQ